MICFSILLLLFYYYFINPSVRLSLQSAETNGQYLPTQMYNAAWIPSRNVFDLTLSPAPLLMLQLFYCTLNETLPLTGESIGGQRGIITPVQGNISPAVGCECVRVGACACVCVGGRSVRERGRVRPLQVHKKGTASSRLILLQSHR